MSDHRQNGPYVAGVCFGMTCQSRFSGDIHHSLQTLSTAMGLTGKLRISERGCCGKCISGPNFMLATADFEGTEVLSDDFLAGNVGKVFLYSGVAATDVPQILQQHVANGVPVRELLYRRQGPRIEPKPGGAPPASGLKPQNSKE
jgi:(2Fe-2S) ferredoxin